MLISTESKTGSVSRELLRVRHQVRLIQPDEEGSVIHRLPAGVYGYASAPGQDAVPVFANKAYHSFEIHKAGDGSEHLIGFVTTSEAALLETGEEGAAINLFPDPWENAQNLVSVPISRIVASKRGLPREDGNPLRFTIG